MNTKRESVLSALTEDKSAPETRLANLQVCARCVYNETVPNIRFDDAGVCNYCVLHDEMEAQYPIGEDGRRHLEQMADEVKRAGQRKKYDCVVGVSGGCDSSYLVHALVELGLRPLAVHFDNTWNAPIATQNIYKVLNHLNVDLYTYVVDNKEFDDIFRSFLMSGVLECDAATDIALTTTLYLAAQKYRIGYIMEGHSFRTEGVAPLGWAYMDGKYIESVHNRYGRIKRRTFPNLTLFRFLRWAAFSNVKRFRPLYYLDYNKEEAKRLLAEKFGWQWYGGHHLENRIAIFGHTYWLPRKHASDQRVLGYAALVRSGQMTRHEGLELLADPIEADKGVVTLVKKRLGFSDEEFNTLMRQPKRHWSDFKTYKRTFERLRWLFWILYKLDRVPKSFYLKFAQERSVREDEEQETSGRQGAA
jgi:N-acetyl sugar amidotransferase